jgi:hypothetical protein
MAVGVETIGNDKSLQKNTSAIRFLWSNAKPVQSAIGNGSEDHSGNLLAKNRKESLESGDIVTMG